MDMVKKRKYITEPEVRFWTVQMAGAIKYMHAKGIIHRDLKMGNIFLDKNMNVKVGDFGLAALLMSGKEYSAARRTTLCGTPNYIAPEILSKDKSGHDHAVDIWSLGIIMYVCVLIIFVSNAHHDSFAMLTGKPPFQSATADEIYRRARDLDYDWPKLDTSENFISEETKDLVSQLLQKPEERPDPDTIVQHAFFTCGWMPQQEEMTPALRDRQPEPTQFLSIGLRGGRAHTYLRNLKKLAVQCNVGPWSPFQKHTSTFRECGEEEKYGLTPKVPLPDDIVYRPFQEVRDEIAKEILDEVDEDDSRVDETVKVSLSSAAPKENTALPTRPVPQSFAAQQRSRPPANMSIQPNRLVKRQPSHTSSVPSSSRALLNLPTRRPSRKVEAPVPEAIPEDIMDVEDRLVKDVMDQLKPVEIEKEADAPTISLQVSASIFHPREKLEHFPNTTPDRIFESLKKLQAELERALNSRSIAVETSKSKPSNTAIVVKWVDYTNKYGLGYILSNGSVGCIFKSVPVDPARPSKGYLPPSCILVRNGELHLRNRSNPSYPDRYQLIPTSGHNIEFYENNGSKGISGGKISPSNFKLPVSVSGEIGRLPRGTDEWDDRRKANIVLWKKFANYMYTYGRDGDYMDEVMEKAYAGQSSAAVPAGNFVTFYQRWGDVGCWYFSDGHFQVCT